LSSVGGFTVSIVLPIWIALMTTASLLNVKDKVLFLFLFFVIKSLYFF